MTAYKPMGLSRYSDRAVNT